MKRGHLNLPKNIERIKRGDKIIFFNPDAPSWIVTNRNGEAILRLCNGKNTKDEITTIVSKKYGTHYKELVYKFLTEAQNSNIFYNVNESQIIQDYETRLSILQISLTSKCNLKCSYCYATARMEQGEKALQLSDYKKLIDDAIEISNHLSVVLTGGEPLMNKDCFAIAEYARQRGCEVHLLTNGTLINEKNVIDINKFFTLVIISIDGSTKELHEKFRGPNSYDKVINALNLLIKTGIDYSISMTVSRLNIHDIGEMANKYGSRLRYAPLFKAGSAKGGRHSISGMEYYNALASVSGVNPLSYCESSLDNAQCNRIHKCAIGDAEISISETGDVYPCQLLHVKEFYAGNILQQSLIDIYQNSSVLNMCHKLTVDRIDGCSKCFLKYVCGGACRARAYYECGKINKSGKFCIYEKEAFINGIIKIYSENIFN